MGRVNHIGEMLDTWKDSYLQCGDIDIHELLGELSNVSGPPRSTIGLLLCMRIPSSLLHLVSLDPSGNSHHECSAFIVWHLK